MVYFCSIPNLSKLIHEKTLPDYLYDSPYNLSGPDCKYS